MAAPKTEDDLAAMTYLMRRGIETEPAKLDRMLVQAIRELEPYPSLQPAEDLTEAEIEELRAAGVDPLTKPEKKVLDLVARGRALYAALLHKALTPEEASRQLGVTPARVRQLISKRALMTIEVEGRARIPHFQLILNEMQLGEAMLRRQGMTPSDLPRRARATSASHRILPGLARVLEAIPPELHLLTFYKWLTTPQRELAVDDLGLEEGDEPVQLSPLSWLEQGRPTERVVALAQGLAF